MAARGMFQGASQLTLDGKGRLTLTRHPDGCVLVYPRPIWEARREQIAQLPYSARALQRLLLGMGAHFELWDATRLAAHEQAALSDGLPAAAADFTF